MDAETMPAGPQLSAGHTAPVGARRPHPSPAPQVFLRPSLAPLFVAFPLILSVSWWAWQSHAEVSVVGWIASVVWTLPLVSTLCGLAGRRTMRRLRSRPNRGWTDAVRAETLVVLVPSIGRMDTYPALQRVVESYCRHLPRYFPRLRVDIVIEEDCEARGLIQELAGSSSLTRMVVVPRRYRTPQGTRFKARANHYAHERRLAEGEARDDVWVLHMDDDTGVGPDTAVELARFINAQRLREDAACHLAQGVLTYPREHAANRLTWMADSIRPGGDISMFAFTTGRGRPLAGLHGELLLIRASVEATIGWDFGPRAVVEDAEFALRFCARYPGRSDWFPGRCLGAGPVTVEDFLRQRERWSWGLFELAVNGSVPLRHRLMLVHNILIWASAPLQHVGVVLVTGLLLEDTDTLPFAALLLPVWALNMAYTTWLYWEGHKINALASARPRRYWWEPLGLVALMPLFALWEAAGVLRGLARFVRRDEAAFTVIAKPL